MGRQSYNFKRLLAEWMAGTGKTSIAHTLSERLDKKEMLGASFFCSHSGSQAEKDASLIIPTIAANYLRLLPHFDLQ